MAQQDRHRTASHRGDSSKNCLNELMLFTFWVRTGKTTLARDLRLLLNHCGVKKKKTKEERRKHKEEGEEEEEGVH